MTPTVAALQPTPPPKLRRPRRCRPRTAVRPAHQRTRLAINRCIKSNGSTMGHPGEWYKRIIGARDNRISALDQNSGSAIRAERRGSVGTRGSPASSRGQNRSFPGWGRREETESILRETAWSRKISEMAARPRVNSGGTVLLSRSRNKHGVVEKRCCFCDTPGLSTGGRSAENQVDGIGI